MGRGKKRQRPGPPPPSSYVSQKRRRPPALPAAVDLPGAAADGPSDPATRNSSPSLVMVTGLPFDCTVLELKSRLEMYGSISRTRIDAVDSSVGYVTFRSACSAGSAIAASLDPVFGVAIRSKRVLVIRAREPPPEWNAGIRASNSKLLRAEIPLSKHGRSNKKLSPASASARSVLDPYKGREIVAYDDLL